MTGDEYVRMIAMSRIMLPNVINIQASWLTVGKQVAQLCLHAGANDFGSIMIEEAILEAGFTPQLRNQQYEYRILPKQIRQQELDRTAMIVD